MGISTEFIGGMQLFKSIIIRSTDIWILWRVSQTAGRSAIFFGAEDGNLEIVKLLIQGGAKLSLKDKVSAV